jgi:hypothetical protein
MTTRTLLFIVVLIFALTLAIVVGNRLSTEALPIAFGIAVGVVVGMPTSVLVAIMTRQTALTVPVQYVPVPDAASASNGGAHDGHTNGNGKRPASHPTRETPVHEAIPTPSVSSRQFTLVGGASAPLLEGDFPGNGGHH